MCYIETTKPVTFYVIYDVGDGTFPLHARIEHFQAGTELDVVVYDTDGDAMCIQFPEGEIVVGIPVDWFRFISKCPTCEDPDDPNPDRSGALGFIPRPRALSRARSRALQRLVELASLGFLAGEPSGPFGNHR